MRAKHLRLWLRAAKREEHPDPGNWEKVIAIIQVDLRGGELTALCARKTVTMIPKGGGTKFREIGLVEILWKAISGIINHRIPSCIQFHDTLHGFSVGRGTGTATLKANLRQQIISMRDTVLHAILLDLRKAYNALERDRCLDILAGYGV